MDQNENKNMESVAEKATEVKDEVVEAAEKTAGEVKEAAETVVEDVKEAKAPEADGDFKEVVENVKEHAEEAGERAKEVAGAAKEKVEEVASKVFTEENKAKYKLKFFTLLERSIYAACKLVVFTPPFEPNANPSPFNNTNSVKSARAIDTPKKIFSNKLFLL